MVESIHNRNQWARIPSTASVKKVKKRGANDGKKEFFKNLNRRYSGREEKESDDLDLAEDDNKPREAMAATGEDENDKTVRKKKKKRGNKIDIRI